MLKTSWIIPVILFFLTQQFVVAERNPFVPVLNFEKNSLKKESKNNLFLAATLEKGESFGAIVGKKEKREVVFVGDRVWGYFVKEINSNSILLFDEENGEVRLTT